MATTSVQCPEASGFQRAVLTFEIGGADARSCDVPISALVAKSE